MQSEAPNPWFHRAVARLALRRRERLLVVDPSIEEAADLRALVGEQGELTLTLRDRATAEALARHDWARVRVLAHAVDGSETFGSFDALLVAVRCGPLLPAGDYAVLARRNLRPGGRFVIDLPGTDMLPDVRGAWRELGWDEEALQPLAGPSDVELAERLRDAGLRNVEAALASHLLHLQAPADLVAPFAELLGLDEEQVTELAHAIVRKRRSAGPLDAMVHRTQVGGLR